MEENGANCLPDSESNDKKPLDSVKQIKSVITRRQVITTAGTIEENVEESRIDQVAGEEVVKTSTSPDPASSQDQIKNDSEAAQYEEEAAPAEESFKETVQGVQHAFPDDTVVTTEAYPSSQPDYQHQQTQELQFTTVEINPVGNVTIEQGEYADLETAPQYSHQYGNNAVHYLQHHQYQNQFQNAYPLERTGTSDSPPSALYRNTDPNLASSSRYQVSF